MKTKSLFLICALLAGNLAAEDRQHNRASFTWNPEVSTEGPVLVAVSLKSQTAAVYRNGVRIGNCEVSSGKPGHETPTGIFHILNKDADHRSKTYGNAPMPYSERLTWDGVALHAGALPGYPSSHGCIHLPYEFSKLLFGITHNGTTVVVTNESPDVHVSDSHHVAFQEGPAADFTWNPHASPAGPVSLVFSDADKRLFVLRNGITIGECPVKTGFFANHPKGTSAFVFAGWKVGGKNRSAESQWVQVGGSKSSHAEPLREWFKLDPRFQHLLQGLLVPGTNLVVTADSVTGQTRSAPGFRVLQGWREEAAEKE
jgi:hypothetical protein